MNRLKHYIELINPDSCSQFDFSLVTSFVVTTFNSGTEIQWIKHGITKLVI